MFYFNAVVSYAKFKELLEEAAELGLSIAPDAADIPDLTDGVEIGLTLIEMGHNFHNFDTSGKPPYHHLVEALIMFPDYERFEVSITDDAWQKLPTAQQWWESRPKRAFGKEDGGEAGDREPVKPKTPADDTGASIPDAAPVG